MLTLLEQHITQLAALRRELQTLKTREEELAASVRSQMQAQGRDVVAADGVQARLVSQERLVVPPRKLRSLLSEQEFMQCVTVNVTQARRCLGDVKLRRIAAITPTVQLRLTPHADAAASDSSPTELQSEPRSDAA